MMYYMKILPPLLCTTHPQQMGQCCKMEDPDIIYWCITAVPRAYQQTTTVRKCWNGRILIDVENVFHPCCCCCCCDAVHSNRSNTLSSGTSRPFTVRIGPIVAVKGWNLPSISSPNSASLPSSTSKGWQEDRLTTFLKTTMPTGECAWGQFGPSRLFVVVGWDDGYSVCSGQSVQCANQDVSTGHTQTNQFGTLQ